MPLSDAFIGFKVAKVDTNIYIPQINTIKGVLP
ncbi:hypothetical protein D047_1139A, partial [Vibrio parahaemolyticus VPTS-2010_2]